MHDYCLSSLEFVTWISLLSNRICHVGIAYHHIFIYCHIVIVCHHIDVVTCLLSHSVTFRAIIEKYWPILLALVDLKGGGRQGGSIMQVYFRNFKINYLDIWIWWNVLICKNVGSHFSMKPYYSASPHWQLSVICVFCAHKNILLWSDNLQKLPYKCSCHASNRVVYWCSI